MPPAATPWEAERVERYRSVGYWTDETYAGLVDRHAAKRPEIVMVSDRERSFTWSEARRWTDAVACGIVRHGLARDDVLATWLPNGSENYLLRIACEKAGVRWLPITRSARGHELRLLLGASGATCLVVALSDRRDIWRELSEVRPDLSALRVIVVAGAEAPGAIALAELAATEPTDDERRRMGERSYGPSDVVMLVPTSGSTGVPKLATYLLAGAMARGRAQTELFHLTPGDAIAATVQGFGPSITALLAAPVAGAQVVVLDHAAPAELLRTIEERRVTIACGVPPIYQELLPLLSRDTARSVRIWYSTGMGMSPALARALEGRTRGIVVSGYGGVDLGCWTSPAPEDPLEVRHHTVGLPRGGTELRLVASGELDETAGEIVARGPSSTAGYFGDPDATRHAWSADGWFRSGDLGRLDDDGNLVLVGRLTELINRGGQKIHPVEVEQLLEQHPLVARAALVPLPDLRLGQRVCAYVVPRHGARPMLEDLVRFLQDRRVASYKLPERLEVVPTFPVSSGGKIARSLLARDLAGKLAKGDAASVPGGDPEP